MHPFSEAQFWQCGTLLTTQRRTLLVGWGKKRWVAQPPPDAPAVYFPDFFLAEQAPWQLYEHWTELTFAPAVAALASAASVLPAPTWHLPQAADFIAGVTEVQALITQGILRKGVPYIFAHAPEGMSPLRLKQALAQALAHASRYGSSCYGFWEEGQGMLGATPELLVYWEGECLHTVACAGTAASAAPLAGAKEQHEHALVVEGLREALAPYGHFETAATRVIQVGALYHLLTPICVQLKSYIPRDELIARLHPTPALGAYPRPAGMQWLCSYATRHPRGRYGAPVGYQLPTGEVCCYVAIRQVQWDERGLHLGAGCGVTAASDPVAEWGEVQAKMQAIRTLLAL